VLEGWSPSKRGIPRGTPPWKMFIITSLVRKAVFALVFVIRKEKRNEKQAKITESSVTDLPELAQEISNAA
jgi:hypothetical protein